MTDIQSTRTTTEIREVIEGLASGRRLPKSVMVKVLVDVMDELEVLRSETRQWYCPHCEAQYHSDPGLQWESCPGCGRLLQPMAWCLKKLYEKKIDSLQAKIENLEFIISQLSKLQ